MFSRIVRHVIEAGAGSAVPSIVEKTGLSEDEAYLLFVHNAYGNLAVNHPLGWKRGPEFDRIQTLLNAYSDGGFEALRRLTAR